ncbi:prephenate dehydrogenase [Achromobacter xylosoxidans]|uniref:Prephenate dehydrogenase/arogenate dehydrogenase family protein n=1 Tax=Alcaligenes xylosoxydans xylosoxydans TaxID=85698 RepID=A0A424W9M8_ALCXX|nr:prephenate dehydrogenase/arogenate dehydrogenase family protein [Achromobacter xylosoxidans]MBC9905223.1 prephenate dehydrogenase/arogenate dehydrogenase family protein [Achromobacter xylosoxidans]MBD0871120.1 prephenate dehydrogenase/arogenate dehydrogenase family protein [Achromobacter xylosoxidans]QNP84372.1 prephenate dehydrogenase/arogenate dehydrogenase family protein [Achromobacter xylosoxidans]RPJ89940.1 prephenate dehydrogenase/arogenate dehydrogenase family protein [Achromobacter x
MNDASPKSDQGAAGPLIPVLAVVGVGLIGGSFAAALRQAGQVGRVLGVGRNAQSLARAIELGLIDEAASAEEAAARADLILLATPVGGLGDVLSRMRAHLRSDTVLTDGGSTKAEVVEAARVALGDRVAQFVPGHPIAGAERSGPEAADAGLYRKRTVILTPLAENGESSLELVRRAWQACGADVIDMDADAHDRVLASVSHLPHLLSAVYMEQVADAADAATRLALAGSGFRDFTRIAAGSPEMWRDIFLSNRDAMLAELADVRAVLDRAERAIADGDGAALLTLLDTAARARRNWRKE